MASIDTFSPISPAILLPLLHRTFDYYTLQYLSCLKPPPKGYKTEYLEPSYVRLEQTQANLGLERGAEVTVRTWVRLLRLVHNSTVRRAEGMSDLDDQRVTLAEAALAREDIVGELARR